MERGDSGDVYFDIFLEGDELDPKIKEKIWLGAYVPLGSLLPKPEFQPKVNMALTDSNTQMAFSLSKLNRLLIF